MSDTVARTPRWLPLVIGAALAPILLILTLIAMLFWPAVEPIW